MYSISQTGYLFAYQKTKASVRISFQVFVLMNSSNPIKLGMFAMMNDTPNIVFKSHCFSFQYSKFYYANMSIKLSDCQIKIQTQKLRNIPSRSRIIQIWIGLQKAVNFNWGCLSLRFCLHMKYKHFVVSARQMFNLIKQFRNLSPVMIKRCCKYSSDKDAI